MLRIVGRSVNGWMRGERTTKPHFRPEVIRLATRLWLAAGSAAYELLRSELVGLPSVRTLQRHKKKWMTNMGVERALSMTVLCPEASARFARNHIRAMLGNDFDVSSLYWSLSIDGTKIEAGMEVASGGEVLGLVAGHGDELIRATPLYFASAEDIIDLYAAGLVDGALTTEGVTIYLSPFGTRIDGLRPFPIAIYGDNKCEQAMHVVQIISALCGALGLAGIDVRALFSDHAGTYQKAHAVMAPDAWAASFAQDDSWTGPMGVGWEGTSGGASRMGPAVNPAVPVASAVEGSGVRPEVFSVLCGVDLSHMLGRMWATFTYGKRGFKSFKFMSVEFTAELYVTVLNSLTLKQMLATRVNKTRRPTDRPGNPGTATDTATARYPVLHRVLSLTAAETSAVDSGCAWLHVGFSRATFFDVDSMCTASALTLFSLASSEWVARAIEANVVNAEKGMAALRLVSTLRRFLLVFWNSSPAYRVEDRVFDLAKCLNLIRSSANAQAASARSAKSIPHYLTKPVLAAMEKNASMFLNMLHLQNERAIVEKRTTFEFAPWLISTQPNEHGFRHMRMSAPKGTVSINLTTSVFQAAVWAILLDLQACRDGHGALLADLSHGSARRRKVLGHHGVPTSAMDPLVVDVGNWSVMMLASWEKGAAAAVEVLGTEARVGVQAAKTVLSHFEAPLEEMSKAGLLAYAQHHSVSLQDVEPEFNAERMSRAQVVSVIRSAAASQNVALMTRSEFELTRARRLRDEVRHFGTWKRNSAGLASSRVSGQAIPITRLISLLRTLASPPPPSKDRTARFAHAISYGDVLAIAGRYHALADAFARSLLHRDEEEPTTQALPKQLTVAHQQEVTIGTLVVYAQSDWVGNSFVVEPVLGAIVKITTATAGRRARAHDRVTLPVEGGKTCDLTLKMLKRVEERGVRGECQAVSFEFTTETTTVTSLTLLTALQRPRIHMSTDGKQELLIDAAVMCQVNEWCSERAAVEVGVREERIEAQMGTEGRTYATTSSERAGRRRRRR